MPNAQRTIPLRLIFSTTSKYNPNPNLSTLQQQRPLSISQKLRIAISISRGEFFSSGSCDSCRVVMSASVGEHSIDLLDLAHNVHNWVDPHEYWVWCHVLRAYNHAVRTCCQSTNIPYTGDLQHKESTCVSSQTCKQVQLTCKTVTGVTCTIFIQTQSCRVQKMVTISSATFRFTGDYLVFFGWVYRHSAPAPLARHVS